MVATPDTRVTVAGSVAAIARSVSLASAGLFVIACGALHILRSDLSPVERMISEYAVGDYGALMTLAFLLMAIACASLILGLTRALSSATISVTGLVLIGVWAVVMVLFAVFPIGVGETVDSTSDVVHRSVAPIGFFGLAAGVFLVSRRFRRDDNWARLSLPGMVVAAVILVAAIAFFVSYGTEAGFDGLAQRVFIIAFLGWLVVVALRLKLAISPRRTE